MGQTYSTHRPVSTDIERILGGIGGLVANTAKLASPRNALAAALTFGGPVLNAFTTPRGTQQAGSFTNDVLAGLTGLGAGVTAKYVYNKLYPSATAGTPGAKPNTTTPAAAAGNAPNQGGNAAAKKPFFPFLVTGDSEVVKTGADEAGIPEYALKKPVTIKPLR
jgi:phage tail tape-measure protein